MKKYDTYKDSGIKWADNIPYDWNVVPLKYKISYEKGKNAALYTKEYLADNFGVIPVYSGQTSNNGIMGFVPNYDYNTEIALLVTTVGAKAMTVNKIEGKFSLSQNCALLLNKSNQTDLKYFYYLLNIKTLCLMVILSTN